MCNNKCIGVNQCTQYYFLLNQFSSSQLEIYHQPSADPVWIAEVPVLGVCTVTALGQYWLVMVGCTACVVLETSTDSVLSNCTASIVEPTFRQYWVNCRLYLLGQYYAGVEIRRNTEISTWVTTLIEMLLNSMYICI